MDDDESQLSKELQDLSWEANALLMAIDEGSEELYEAILSDSDNPAGILMLATGTMKAMVDFLLVMVNEAGVNDFPIQFADLVRMAAEHLTESHTDE
jgi:hypothetical protein